MFERDYLQKMMLQFIEAILRSITRAREEKDLRSSIDMLEYAIGEATDIDGSVLLSLSPESIATVMQMSGVDYRVTEYVARSLQLDAMFNEEAGELDMARLRNSQARAIAQAYCLDLPDAADLAEIEAYFKSLEAESA